MEQYELFYKWVPAYIRYPALLLLFFVALTANGVFLGNTTETFSTLGVYTEPYIAAYNAMYLGMGVGLMVHSRLKLRFTGKSLLLFGLVMMLFMNIVCATTHNPTLTIVACLILGFTKISAYTEIYVTWIKVWTNKFDISRVYPFVYVSALGGSYFMTWLTTKLAYHYDYKYSYIWVILLILLCLLITVVFVEYHSLKKRIQLYQIDWIGAALLIITLLLFNYVVVYGKVENWLESKYIVGASFLCLIMLMLFIKREISFKRPVFPLELFRLPNFRMGILYFLLMNVFIPTTFQSAFGTSVLHFEAYRNTEINLFLIPGIITGSALCYYWYYHHYDEQLIILIGFIAILTYHIIMYESFGSSFTINDFWLPSVIKGFALALLYISVGLYITSHQKMQVVLTVPGIAILARSFLGSGAFTAIFTYLLYSQRIRHLEYLGSMSDSNNYLQKDQGSSADFYNHMQLQATLNASKELSGYIIIAGIVIVFILLIRYVYHKVNDVDVTSTVVLKQTHYK